ncbi:uncharacterized protein LOC103967468 isoform X4 [Pyrus x bretschneideri]|uniref:uncharacterized protein LOC103967468 isoform X4 n=1 Tax=Pyrus x bretschneideri TaxID=225117 RepID=UPI0020306A45|nr:uncharacterized protein LOC103967468 isoform X4 [Pyrus x bretschneideri]
MGGFACCHWCTVWSLIQWFEVRETKNWAPSTSYSTTLAEVQRMVWTLKEACFVLEDFKLFYDAKFGRKKTPELQYNGLSTDGAVSNGSSNSRVTAHGNM